MGTSYRKFHVGLNVKPKAASTSSAQGDLEVSSVTGKISYHDGTTNSPLVTEAGTATLTNKTLTGNTATNLVNGSGTFNINSTGTVTVPNTTDTLVGRNTTDTLTNKTLTGNTAVNLVSGAGTLVLNTTGTITIPNATDTLVGKATTDTLSNKTLDNTSVITIKDTNFTIQDDGDTSKQLKFQASGITTATTRTLTAPDANTTIVGTDATQTLTNKTLTGNTAVNLISGAGTLVLNTTGTVTVPNGTATLATIAANTWTGEQTFSAQVRISDGTVGEPSIVFTSDDDTTGTGIYRVAANSMGFSANGVKVGQYSSGGNWTLAVDNTNANTINGSLTLPSLPNAGRILAGPTNDITSGVAGQLHLTGIDSQTDRGVVIQCENGAANNINSMVFLTSNSASPVEAGRISNLGAWSLGPTAGGVTNNIRGRLDFTVTESTVPANGIRRSGTNILAISTNTTDRITIGAGGGVTIGPADVTRNVLAQNSTATASSTARGYDAQYTVDTDCTGGYFYACVNSAGTVIGRIEAATNTTTTFTGSSDSRLKQDPQTFNGMDLIMQMIPRDFEWKSNPGMRSKGFFAQELNEVYPDAVSVGSDTLTEQGALFNPWGVDYGRLTPVLVKALQELKTEFDAYKASHP